MLLTFTKVITTMFTLKSLISIHNNAHSLIFYFVL